MTLFKFILCILLGILVGLEFGFILDGGGFSNENRH